MKDLRRITLSLAAVLALLSAGIAQAATLNSNIPAWSANPHTDVIGDLVVRVLTGTATQAAGPSNSGTPCAAEPSTTGNVQVNCRAEDGTSPQNTQSETTVAAFGQKVVVGYNDSLVCCTPALNFTGYSVSNDGGKTFTDEGDLPWQPNVQPIGDPAVARDGSGNFYFTSLALNAAGIGAHSMISFYKMPAGSSTFKLISVPVDVGGAQTAFADKDYLAVGKDASGQTHFYITWTFFSSGSPYSPIMLTDSIDGVHWRTTMVSSASACAQGSNPVPSGGTLYVSWEESVPAGCTDVTVTAAYEKMATVDVASAAVQAITTIAPVRGSGDTIVACNNASDLREVIETETGHDARNFEMPNTFSWNGVLYAVWNDRPNGIGGVTTNATRIFLSYSLDGNQHWSAPQVISGKLAHGVMNDRFQPWITADASGLHAAWYERVAGTPVDVLRFDKEDLSFATPTSAPSAVGTGETPISSVTFPIVQTNPQQDPVISFCYMGDYTNITSNGTTRFVTWGDNRNMVTTSAGTTENQPDVFLQTY